MIEIFSLYNNITTNITPLCKTISISGDKQQIARKLEVSLAYSIFDRNQPRTQVGPGTKVWAILDGKEIFRGIVWDRQLNSSEELSFTAYDYLIYLTKSKVTYNFKNITCQDATKKICSELGITVGTLASTGRFNRIIQAKSAYEAIMEMYTQDSKLTGNQYIPVMDGLKLNVIKKGSIVSNFSLNLQLNSNENNISSVNYSDSIDSMVNRVKIYDDKNNLIGQIENSNWIKSFGVLQENYTREENINPITAAKNMLNGVTQNVSIESVGNWDCRTGYAVRTEIFYLDALKNVIMYIDGDTHTWDPATGKHIMNLTLSFKNTMDEKGD